jgi:hypothetical protein
MDLSLEYSPWLLLGALVVAAGLSYWTYRKTLPSLALGWRLGLGSLRFLSLALLLFLLLQPVLRQLNESTEPPVLAVLVDHSESLQVVTRDNDSASAATAREALRPVLSSATDDLTVGSASAFAFDQDLRAAGPLDSLAFDGARTNIGAALEQVPAELQDANLQGVLLISDGQYTTGQSPLRVADRYPVPIHTVTVGDTARQRDLQVRRVVTNDIGYTDSEVPVRALLQAEEIAEQPVRVTLRSGDSLVAETEVRLPGGTAEVPVDLSFRPQTPGLTQLSVEAAPVPNEATTRNNVRSTSLRVLDQKRQVLLLGAAPSPTFTAVRRVLAEDANTRLTARIPRRDGSFYGGPLPDTLDRYDAFVVAGFPSDPVPAAATQRVADVLTEDGLPTLFFLDRQTDLTAWTDAFGSLLPARPSSESLDLTPGTARLGEAARSHPVFETDASLDLFAELPPLHVPGTAWSPAPDAEVLATARADAGPDEAPLLILRERAGQRTSLFLGTGTERWATLPPSLASADPLWPALVSNVLRWAAAQDQDQPVQVRPVASQFDGAEPVELTGQVYDESMAPVASATVDVTVTDSTGSEYSYVMDPAGDGRYDLDVGTLPEGPYDYRAVARRSGTVLGRDQGEFSVGALRVEYQASRADPVLMRQIAARAGGRAYDPATLSSLASDLAASSSFAAETVTNPTETELWRQWPFLALVLLLLATEWTLRKRLGLS